MKALEPCNGMVHMLHLLPVHAYTSAWTGIGHCMRIRQVRELFILSETLNDYKFAEGNDIVCFMGCSSQIWESNPECHLARAL